MEKIKAAYEELNKNFHGSEYEDCITHYGNNLLNLLFTKYAFNEITNNLSNTDIQNLKKDILGCIKDLEVILEDEEVLKYLKKNYDNGNYDGKRVLIAVKNIDRYIKKYYK